MQRAEDPRGWRVSQIAFLALSLDSLGAPIPVVSSDPATLLFLNNAPDDLRQLVIPFTLPYPVGLFVKGLGPLVCNDAYATREVWESFRADEYHSPRVVWGREVNLLLLGLCSQLQAIIVRGARGADARSLPYIHLLRSAIETVQRAVENSGMKDSELWTYAISGSGIAAARNAASCDIQLWNLTDLAVQFQLDRLPK